MLDVEKTFNVLWKHWNYFKNIQSPLKTLKTVVKHSKSSENIQNLTETLKAQLKHCKIFSAKVKDAASPQRMFHL
jgi:hypothetical protein